MQIDFFKKYLKKFVKIVDFFDLNKGFFYIKC
jgi:hypothetical protein